MNWRLLILGGAGVAAAGAGLLLLQQQQQASGDPPDDDDGPAPNPNQAEHNVGIPPPIGDSRWGSVPSDLQKLLTRTQQVSKIPYLWVYGSICAHRESGFNTNAHNADAQEVDGSTKGIDAGLKRGNPSPKFADAIRTFGSGGLFGALASSFAWIGMDEGFMPFLKRKPTLVYEPEASAVFLAHYFWRITSPTYANGRKLTLFDVRVGWASPTMLKDTPNGTKANAVRDRMREDIAKLGWDEEWVTSLPVIRDQYAGIKAVATAYGYKPSQED